MVAFYEEDPGAPDYDVLEASALSMLTRKGKSTGAAHHSDSLDWVDSFRQPIACSCGSHEMPRSATDGALVHLASVVDSVKCDSTSTERKNKRQRLLSGGVDFLNCERVFTYFEALNSGLVLAKKYL